MQCTLCSCALTLQDATLNYIQWLPHVSCTGAKILDTHSFFVQPLSSAMACVWRKKGSFALDMMLCADCTVEHMDVPISTIAWPVNMTELQWHVYHSERIGKSVPLRRGDITQSASGELALVVHEHKDGKTVDTLPLTVFDESLADCKQARKPLLLVESRNCIDYCEMEMAFTTHRTLVRPKPVQIEGPRMVVAIHNGCSSFDWLIRDEWSSTCVLSRFFQIVQ